MILFKKSEKPKIIKSQYKSEKKIQRLSAIPTEHLYKEVSSSPAGITSDYAQKMLKKHGKNAIMSGEKDTFLLKLKEAFINPFNIILFAIGFLTVIVDIFLDGDGKIDYLTDSIIFILILVSGIIAFIQNGKSSAAAEKLSKLISKTSHVYRDGELIGISIDEIVVGDVVKLSAGDMIPADIRFLATKDTFVSQSVLTGESNPVEKFSVNKDSSKKTVTDLDNMGFMGSNIISGSATAVVIATGDDTFFGSISDSLNLRKSQNSFERGVNSVSKVLINNMIIMVPVVFSIILIKSLFFNSPTTWIDALLFAVAVAVGITPEMLPVVMTSSLAKGAMEMYKSKVIVKTLSSIQTFGEMDILCTDKTGTLTEDKIELEKYMDINGERNMRILHHAYVISHFQTGLKNLIDMAIINRAKDANLESSLQDFEVVDEIPFDFARRRMSVVLQDETGFRRLLTKGAVEEVLSICSFMETNGRTVKLTQENRKTAMDTYKKFNSEGLRMIAIAQKLDVPGQEKFDTNDENDMVLIGFIGFLDPPKKSAKSAIEMLGQHGVRTVVLTGDSEGVAIKVCEKVGVKTNIVVTGKDLETMNEETLLDMVDKCDLFVKLNPLQKERVVKAYKAKGHTVGYMGDGINDAPPMHQADVSISVDSAVDIAKETADIILLKKDLMILEKGVLEGRRIFGNIIKYIKLASSGNFGNMFSVIVASLFLPFLPMIPIQILCQNLLLDFSQLGISFDNMDPEYLKVPRKWETRSIKTFMYFMGSVSSIFDILCFVVLWFVIGANTQHLSPLFQCGWFLFGSLSQTLVLHIIRTSKLPFIQSNAAAVLTVSTLAVSFTAVIIGFSDISKILKMQAMPLSFGWILSGLLILYFVTTQICKKIYIRYFSEWI